MEEIEQQLEAAYLGIQQTVTDMQTRSGVKDKILQYWIGQLIPRGRLLRHQYLTDPKTRDPRLNRKNILPGLRAQLRVEAEAKIKAEQRAWLIRQPKDHYDALPVDSRKVVLLHVSA